MDKRSILTILAVVMGLISIFLFTVFKDSNKITLYTATVLLIAGFLLIMWIHFFFNVKPLKLSIILTAIVVGSSMLVMYIFKVLQIDFPSAPTAVIASYTIANYLNKNLEQIEKIFNKYFLK